MTHILSAEQFTEQEINNLFEITKYFKQGGHSQQCVGKLMGTLFFEPSTRTRWSSEAAMLRLGGQVLSMENAFESSSNKKGEVLEDTLRTVSQYVDVIVIRHPKAKIISEVANHSQVPVINGGDGHNEHPTQALLDYFTIKEHFSNDDRKLNILFTGDLVHSRTIRSLKHLLKDKMFVHSAVSSPAADGMGICYNEKHIDKIIPDMDIIYMTRNQLERKETHQEISRFIMTKQLAETMKEDAIIMHPLPRNNEISHEVDSMPQAKYWEQAKNGMYVRMALLTQLI